MRRRTPAFDVVKASGKTEPYDRRKILDSLRRAGAGPETARRVLAEAERDFHPGISTRRIFDLVMDLLEKGEERAASFYNLKGSIRRLGPAGYSFETFIGEILREQGWETALRQAVAGKCARHEIDVLARRDGDHGRRSLLVECKYHQAAGTFVELKELLYTWARLLDINERPGNGSPYDAAMLVSNTRLSSEAAAFAACRRIEVLTWKHPEGSGLEDLIRKGRLWPVTILRSAAPLGAEVFSRAELMLVRDFAGREPAELAGRLDLPLPRTTAIVREAERLLGGD